MLDFIKSIIFGIIEGITEWLPVSSTGHLIIAENIFNFQNVTKNFYEMYSVVIQLGASLAVATAFFKRLFPFSKIDNSLTLNKAVISLWGKIIVGCIPAGIIGVLFDDLINTYFFSYKTVAFTLIIYGILFIIVENRKKTLSPTFNNISELPLKNAFLIGLFQVLSLIPGTSRSGATILGGMLTGLDRVSSAEFSFFMAIPVMVGASFIKLLNFGFSFTLNEFLILAVGFVTAFTVSVFAVNGLVGFVKNHSFKAFGIYRIILGIAVLIYFNVR